MTSPPMTYGTGIGVQGYSRNPYGVVSNETHSRAASGMTPVQGTGTGRNLTVPYWYTHVQIRPISATSYMIMYSCRTLPYNYQKVDTTCD